MRTNLARTAALLAVAAVAVTSTPAYAQQVEWRSYGSDVAGTKYTPLDQINRDTVGDLEIVWRQSVLPDAIRGGRDIEASIASQNTPLMADGRLYISSGLGTVAAVDAKTGEVLWFDEPPDRDGEPFQRVRQTRGVAYWEDEDSGEARVLAVVGAYLVALDARTGERFPDFGEGGEVDLRKGYHREVETFSWGSAPIVVNDVAVIGSNVTDIVSPQQPALKLAAPGDVRGFDVRTGEQVWIFRTVPQEGEYGNDTWLTAIDQDRPSWEYTGHTNMWAWASADEELGYVYLPLSTPTNDYYGRLPAGRQPVRRKHRLPRRAHRRAHLAFPGGAPRPVGLRLPAAPNVVDITVDGRASRPCHRQQTGVHLRVRPRDRRAGLADRGAPGGAGRHSGRVVRADAAVSDQTAAVRPAGDERRRSDRLHPGAPAGSAGDLRAVRDRPALHGAFADR